MADFLATHFQESELESLKERLAPKPHKPERRIPRDPGASAERVAARWEALGAAAGVRDQLCPESMLAECESYARNIEHMIGTVRIPVGVAGPIRVNGLFAQGDYLLPLATTEAALVASYNRGAQLITRSGGATAVLLNEGMSRAPGFAFADVREAGHFVLWVLDELPKLRQVAESTTRFGKLIDLNVTIEGNHVYLRFEFTTEDAAGQNMVTLATEAACDHIAEHSPVKPAYFFVEANMSGDKKASAQSFLGVRGRKVTAEIVLPRPLVKAGLHTTPDRMVDYWRMSALGGVLSGTIGVQGHYANGLAALYIACGQDAACVSESAVGVTRFECTAGGDLYAAVTLPNLVVGTVGGGTGLPSQNACLELMGLAGAGHARALAEVCAGLCLAGELSIIGALAAGHFARAHRQLARG